MILLAPEIQGNWWPLADGHVPSDAFVAGSTLEDLQRGLAPEGASQYANAWIHADDWALCGEQGKNALLEDHEGRALGFIGDGSGARVMVSPRSFLLLYPWQLIQVNEQIVGALSENEQIGEVSPAAHIEGVIHVGKGTRILPGVFIEGNVIIGENCKIGPNAYIRGNTSIGDGCHIGQAVEIKNSVIAHGSSVGHLSYVGDSVIGRKVNFGAATVTSNLRHDGKNHRTQVGGDLVDTGRRKFGTIVGDGVHTGIHTAIYPGRKLGPNATTRPNDSVDCDIK
ncbi:hypothetical protein [Rubritalea marina]|uniref:hypothetical protein n=1 Tax=Rubritalea marina TaxID=361055 RepID=UPI00035C29DF|nr:hypothetical protein [Rubritalea marina]